MLSIVMLHLVHHLVVIHPLYGVFSLQVFKHLLLSYHVLVLCRDCSIAILVVVLKVLEVKRVLFA